MLRFRVVNFVNSLFRDQLVGLMRKAGNDTTNPRQFRFASKEGVVSLLYGLDVQNKLVLSFLVIPAGGRMFEATTLLGWWGEVAMTELKKEVATRRANAFGRRLPAR